jgi:hypothetical protein
MSRAELFLSSPNITPLEPEPPKFHLEQPQTSAQQHTADEDAKAPVVQPGETLFELAHRYQIPQSQIIGGPADPKLLRQGQRLAIPLGPDAGTAPVKDKWREADTLQTVADRHDVSAKAVWRANAHSFAHGQQPKAGDTIWVPGVRTASTPDPTPPETASAPEPLTLAAPVVPSVVAEPAATEPTPVAQAPAKPETPAEEQKPKDEPKAKPATVTAASLTFVQHNGWGTRGSVVAQIPLNKTGTAQVQLTASQDVRQAFDGSTTTGLSRAYVHASGTAYQSDWLALKLTGGFGTESTENPKLSDKPLGYLSTISVTNLKVNADVKLGSDKHGNLYGLTTQLNDLNIRRNDGVDDIRLSAVAGGTMTHGPFKLTVGGFGQKDIVLPGADAQSVSAMASLKYDGKFVDANLTVYQNLHGRSVVYGKNQDAVPGVNAEPGGATVLGTKGMLEVSIPMEIPMGWTKN